MNIIFAIIVAIIAISTSVISYCNYPQIEEQKCVENWIRNILCMTSISIFLSIIIATIVAYYTLLYTGRLNNYGSVPVNLVIISMLVVSYSSWDFLTRNEFIQERQTVKMLFYIFVFIVLIESL